MLHTVHGSSGFFPSSSGQRSHTLGGAVAMCGVCVLGLLQGINSGTCTGLMCDIQGLRWCKACRPPSALLSASFNEWFGGRRGMDGSLLAVRDTGTDSDNLARCSCGSPEPVCVCVSPVVLYFIFLSLITVLKYFFKAIKLLSFSSRCVTESPGWDEVEPRKVRRKREVCP